MSLDATNLDPKLLTKISFIEYSPRIAAQFAGSGCMGLTGACLDPNSLLIMAARI